MKKKFMALGCVLLAMAAAVPAGISTNIVHAEETVSDRAQVYEDIEKFPESYKDDLYELKKKHPDWVFEVYDTGLEWSSVMYNEMNPASRSLVPSYFSSDFVGGVYGDGWSYATEAAVEYYLDPLAYRELYIPVRDVDIQCSYTGYCDGTEGACRQFHVRLYRGV